MHSTLNLVDTQTVGRNAGYEISPFAASPKQCSRQSTQGYTAQHAHTQTHARGSMRCDAYVRTHSHTRAAEFRKWKNEITQQGSHFYLMWDKRVRRLLLYIFCGKLLFFPSLECELTKKLSICTRKKCSSPICWPIFIVFCSISVWITYHRASCAHRNCSIDCICVRKLLRKRRNHGKQNKTYWTLANAVHTENIDAKCTADQPIEVSSNWISIISCVRSACFISRCDWQSDFDDFDERKCLASIHAFTNLLFVLLLSLSVSFMHSPSMGAWCWH